MIGLNQFYRQHTEAFLFAIGALVGPVKPHIAAMAHRMIKKGA